MNESVAEVLNQNLEQLTGCKIGAENIKTDKSGSFGHIPSGSLLRGRPIILSHFVGRLFVILPYKDWEELSRGKVPVWRYINDSIWSYGYYLAGPSLKDNLFWQELEGGRRGIHDKEKVQRYLTIMQCRTHFKHLDKMPDEARCADCLQKSCPMSTFKPKKRGASWKNEVKERYVRVEFQEALEKMLKQKFGLKLASLQTDAAYNETEEFCTFRESLYLFPGFVPGTVRVVVSEKLMIDMLYHPHKYDARETVERAKLMAAFAPYDSKTRKAKPVQYMNIAHNTTTAELNKFWERE